MFSLPWYHGFLPRALAEKRLAKDGSFLVYNTLESPNSTLLCIKWNGQCYNLPVQSPNSVTQPGNASSYSLGGPEFSSLNKLISYYKDNQLPIDLKSGAILFTPVLKPTSSEGSSDCGIPSILTTRGLRSSDSDLSNSRCPRDGIQNIQGSKGLCRRPAVRVFNDARSLHNLADFSHAQFANVNGFRKRGLSANYISDNVNKNLNTDSTAFPPGGSALQNGAHKQQEIGKPKLDRKQIRYLVMNEQPPKSNFNTSADDLISLDSSQSPLSLRRSNLYTSDYGDLPSGTASLVNSQYAQPLKSGVTSASLPFLTDVYVDPSLFNFDTTSSRTYVPSVPSETPRKPSPPPPSREIFARNSSKPPLPSTSSRPPSIVPLQLDVLCQGFINYDLTRADRLSGIFELPSCEDNNFKPLNSALWQSIGTFLLSDLQPSDLARALSLESVHLLMLRWAAAPSTPASSSGPSDGFSLILWPAANGYREDLLNRDRFLSLFVIASVVLQPQLERRTQILLLWLRAVNCLLSEYKDNLSSNGLLNGIFSSQVSSLTQTWRNLLSMGNTELSQESLSDLRSQMVSVERCPLSSRAVEIYASCFSTTSVCIPNLVPLVSLLCRAAKSRLGSSSDRQRSLSGSLSSLFEGSAAGQHQEQQSGVTPVPSPCLTAYLDTARRVYRSVNARRNSSSSSSCPSSATPHTSLWIEKLESESQFETPRPNSRKLVSSENLLLSLIGPVLIDRGSQMDLFHTKLNYALTCLAERLEAQ